METNRSILPQRPLETLADVDQEAMRVKKSKDWQLAAFIAMFNDELDSVLLVQLGDYASARYGGRPWTLPGGAVEPNELPSQAILRELREEAGCVAEIGSVRLAGWFPRPYFQSHRHNSRGELLLLYAGIMEDSGQRLTASPPETMATVLYPYSLYSFLGIPTTGIGEHPLQPMPRHWAYWARVGQIALEYQLRPPLMFAYNSAEELARAPWSPAEAPAFQSSI